MQNSPDFIQGIFNYCDRWCERCPFVSRCGSHSLGEELKAEMQEREARNRRFWGELGIDSDLEITMPNYMENEDTAIELDTSFEKDLRQSKIEDHTCVLMARDYMASTRVWLKKNGSAHENKPFLKTRRRDAPENRSIVGLDDAIEVVAWYHVFIYMKLLRAISGLYDVDGPDTSSDHAGSAKIALIAIDRSIAAWQAIEKQGPWRKAQTRPFMSRLVGLRHKVEEALPNARLFKRPGFDD